MDILKILNNYFEVRVVGGSVRDHLIEKYFSLKFPRRIDYDIVVKADFLEIVKILKAHNLNYFDDSAKYGVLKIHYKDVMYDIAAPRKDLECFGRAARVVSGSHISWLEDSMRRDFSINAIYCDIKNVIHDYHSGINDLKAQKITFVGDAVSRIKEDYLRILRFFRFSGLFYAPKFDDYDIKILREHRDMLQSLSKERVRKEMMSLLKTPYCMQSLKIMKSYEILEIISPALNQFIEKNSVCVPYDDILNIACILIQDGDSDIATIMESVFQLSKEITLTNREFLRLKTLMKLYEYIGRLDVEMDDEECGKRAVFLFGVQTYVDFMKICNAVMGEKYSLSIEKIEEYAKIRLPINGNDIKPLVRSNADIGEYKKKATQIYIDSNFTATKEEIMMQLSLLKNE